MSVEKEIIELVYRNAIKNVKYYIRNSDPESSNCLDVFELSTALAVAFNKTKEQTIQDIMAD